MEKKMMAITLIMTLLVSVLLPGIVLAAGNDSHGSGPSHSTGSKNVKVNPNNNTQPMETPQGQEMTGSMLPAAESHETVDDHGGGGHGTKITEKNYSFLYVFLIINLAVLLIAGYLKYFRRTVVA